MDLARARQAPGLGVRSNIPEDELALDDCPNPWYT